MIEIPLTQGKVALIDDEDYERLSRFKWHAHFDGWNWYARTAIPSLVPRQRILRMHREVIEAPRGVKVDHRDGDGLNNQRHNLRLATSAENGQNAALSDANTSGYKGVTWHKGAGKWYAQINIDGKRTYLGLFTDPVEAAQAYDAAALEHYGKFARLNGDSR